MKIKTKTQTNELKVIYIHFLLDSNFMLTKRLFILYTYCQAVDKKFNKLIDKVCSSSLSNI